jgi:hypothetical protein
VEFNAFDENVSASRPIRGLPIAEETAQLNLKAAFSMHMEKAIEYVRDLQTICFATADAAEAVRHSRRSVRPSSSAAEKFWERRSWD